MAERARPPEGGEASEERRRGEERQFQQVGGFWVLAFIYSSVGFSIYFALGVVADRGLGLTPLIFLASGLLFVITTMTYVEGGAMLRERGGASAFARHAFDELVAFVAGWAILIDYLIVIALAVVSVPHYLEPVIGDHGGTAWPAVIGIGLIVAVALLNILDVTGKRRARALIGIAAADMVLQLLVVVVGVAVIWHPDRLTENLDLFATPTIKDTVYAAVLAMLAYAGIEAASNLAPELDVRPRQLRSIVTLSAWGVPLVYAGMAVIALMALPVVMGPGGPHTELGGRYVEAPVLGVVSSYDPGWLADAMRWLVALVAAPVLFWAAATAMLGVSRHTYALAVNRQIPSWLGKLGEKHETPYVAIWICALACAGLVVIGDVEVLAGIYALGATLAISIAHLSLLKLRISEPDRARPYAMPLSVRIGGNRLPLPALFGAVLSLAALVSVFLFHDTARWVGGGWMVVGLVGYVVYRKAVEGISLTERITVQPRALTKKRVEVSLHDVLVPIFGSELDDDIVGTAGRLAAEEDPRGGGGARLNVVYVIEVPLSKAIDCELDPETEHAAIRAVERARDVAEEYEDVVVRAEIVRSRKTGAGIVDAARRWDAEAIVMGAEPPSKVKGGAHLGGVGAARPEEVGPVTAYVLRKAPCRVLLTAPPERPA